MNSALRKLTRKTASYPDSHMVGCASTSALTYTITGMCGEAGEIANKLKKILRKDERYWCPLYGQMTEDSRKAIVEELADVLWYVDATAFHLGYTIEEIFEVLQLKLESRIERGTIQGDGDER